MFLSGLRVLSQSDRACVKIGFKIINFHFIEYKGIKMQINKYLFADFEFSHSLDPYGSGKMTLF